MKGTTADAWSEFITGWLDLLTLAALAGTGEVSPFVLVSLPALWGASRFSRLRVSERALVLLLLATIVGAIAFWRAAHVHPIVAAAHAAPVAHGLAWFAPRTGRYRGWRLGLGFVDLLLASALTADLYLPVAVFTFAILASVALSCNFLDVELRRIGGVDDSKRPLPPAFIRYSLSLSVVVFLTSVVIFPLLPRRSVDLAGAIGSIAQVGYSEEVNISERSSVLDSGGGEPMLRLYPPEGVDLTFEIPMGLLRARTLDSFDGKRWRPVLDKAPHPGRRAPPLPTPGIEVLAVREPLESDVLPVPYFTRETRIHRSDGTELRPERLVSGERIAYGSSRARAQYVFTLPKDAPGTRFVADPADAPRPEHSEIPPELRTHRMRLLAGRLFGTSPARVDPEASVQSVLEYYRRNGFQAAFAGGDDDDGVEVPKVPGMTALEDFLFVRHEGHCEWFASAAAVLLRMAGVPTRLVSGFRISRAASAGVLTLRGGDAHAWLEYWSPERGWVPLDPTPRQIRVPNLGDFFRERYDQLSAVWFRYVIGYSDQRQYELGREAIERVQEQSALLSPDWPKDFPTGAIAWALVALAASVAGVLAWRRLGAGAGDWVRALLPGRDRRNRARAWLRYERSKMDELLSRRRLAPLPEWEREYERARFGRPLPETELALLREKLRALRLTMSPRRPLPRTAA